MEFLSLCYSNEDILVVKSQVDGSKYLMSL